MGEGDIVNSSPAPLEPDVLPANRTRLQVLQVEDDLSDSQLVLRELRRDGFDVTSKVVQTPEEFREQVRSTHPDVVLADYNLGHWRGIEAVQILREEGLEIPLILVTGALGEITAVDCIKQGATDYVLKDRLARLGSSVRRALLENDLRERQKRSDAALRESQAQLEGLVQTAMDAILTVDGEQRIVLFNAAAEKMFRCSKAEAMGQPLERFIPERFRAAHAAHMKRFAATGATNRAKGEFDALRAMRADGEEFPMAASISRTQVGDRTQFTVILRDITERQRAEKKLAQKMEELARSNEDLEQFAYAASHDLQEPLRMVAAYTQLLAERYRGQLDANADKYIGYAVEGATRMQVLIRDLLAFSRVDRNGTERSDTDCNSALEEALLNLQAAIQESGAAVTRDRLPVVAANRSQMIQLFQNLIGNAIKFRGKEAPVIRVSAERQGDHWQFAVTDNGIGIAPEHKEIIFVIFRRLHAREEYSGNGVGLAICKKIVEHHGGRIWVESEPGQGCTFRFTLPAHPADDKEEAHDLLQTCNSAGG
jgi:PAS domain S-box-containing protein